MRSVSWEADLRPLVVRALRVATEGRTYLNLLYLFLSLPLAIVYFIVLLGCAVAGAILAPVGIGLLILALGLVAAHGFELLERDLAVSLLRVELPPSAPLPAGSLWSRLRIHLARQQTWKSLAYLLLKLPLGLFTLTIAIAFLFPSLLAILDFFRSLLPGRELFGPLTALPGALLGSAAVIALMYGGNLLAGLWSKVAMAMIGPSDEQRLLLEAQRKAEAADRKRRELILNVSHELRTPIASIQGHLDSLLMPPETRPAGIDEQQYLSVAAAETRRLSALVGELLDLARADASELAMTIHPVDVVSIARNVALTLGPLALSERRVTLVDPNGAPSATALADPQRLTQVLTNLLRNAINHTPPGGAVRVQTTIEDPQHVVIAVADTGTGIAPEDLPRVFERFYRTDAARSRDAGGFGLGLSIARDLVEAMGGSITVTSEVGVGSTFSVHLRTARAG